jgi:hypothetical protein
LESRVRGLETQVLERQSMVLDAEKETEKVREEVRRVERVVEEEREAKNKALE